jgi:hypothetical protein
MKLKTKTKIFSLSFIVCLFLLPLFISLIPTDTSNSRTTQTQRLALLQNSSLQPYITTSTTTSDFDPTEKIYLTGNSLIQDFSFDTIDNISISGNQAFGGRLQMQRGANWIIDRDDVETLYSYKSGNRTISALSFPAKLNVTFFTSLDLTDGCRKMVQKDESIQIGYLKHHNLFGLTRYIEEQYLTYSYYDFGDVQQYNSLYNDFSGSIDMSFNIIDTGLPQMVEFGDTTYQKSFQYVGVSSAQVNSYYTFNLTSSAPNLYGQAPNSPTTDNEASFQTGDEPIAKDGYTLNWDHDVSVTPLTPASVSFDGGITPQAEGSSLSPSLANGSDIYAGEYRSMPNCKVSYSLSSLSPIVKEYYSELQYTSYRTILKDDVVGFLKIGPTLVGETIDTHTRREPMALHIINRGIMTELQVNFIILNAYETEVLEVDAESMQLQEPEENVEEQGWTAMVAGMQNTTLSGEGTDLMPLVQSLLFLDAVAKTLAGESGGSGNPFEDMFGGAENAGLGGDDWESLSPMGKLKRIGWWALIGGIAIVSIIILYYVLRFAVRQRRENQYHKQKYSSNSSK